MLLRISASLLLMFSVLFLPFWVSVLLALVGMVYFAYFWEASAIFLLSDFLYGAREMKFNGMVFVSFVVSIFVIAIIEIIKRKIKFYK